MRERRKFVRIPEEEEISYRILPNAQTEMFMTRDISQGGIRFFVAEYVPEKSLIEIRLTIKEIPFSFKAVVEVKWAKKEPHSDRYEIGVEFINIPQDATKYLINYIESVVKEQKKEW